MNFEKRSTAPELMDDPNLDESELRLALKDIATVNRFLGGNKITISALEKMIAAYPEKKKWNIVDVGCGDGEVLRQIATYFNQRYDQVSFLGVDINDKSIDRARKKSADFDNLTFSTQNILTLKEDSFPCDIILCTLTMHHFSDEQILTFLRKFGKLAAVGIIINDLERSKLAYRLFQVFSSIFMKSKIARYDGRVSIMRSFKREELEIYSKKLALTKYSIHWKWAFRYVWVIKNI